MLNRTVVTRRERTTETVRVVPGCGGLVMDRMQFDPVAVRQVQQ